MKNMWALSLMLVLLTNLIVKEKILEYLKYLPNQY